MDPYGSYNNGLTHPLSLFFKVNIPFALVQQVEERRAEATKFSLLTPKDPDVLTVYAFNKYIIMFFEHDIFDPSIAPFISKNYGPDWFKRELPPFSPDHQGEVLDIWLTLLQPTILSTRITMGNKGLDLVSYQPNLVAQ